VNRGSSSNAVWSRRSPSGCWPGCRSSSAGIDQQVAKAQRAAAGQAPVKRKRFIQLDAHLTIVFAALAVSRWIEETTGWSIKKFVTTAAAIAPSTSRRRPHPHRRKPHPGRNAPDE
jgi:hypothetical protein